ncbi:MAG: TRAP transporter large permease subunit, partial [Salinispira sp.]
FNVKRIAAITLHSFPALLTPVILLLGIYTGVVTPTEAGALAGVYALIVALLVYRAIGIKDLWEILRQTVRRTGAISIIVGSAFTTAYIVAIENVPEIFATVLLSISADKYVILLVINVLFLFLGMFIDTSTITVVFIPMVLPLVKSLGIDLVHFGVVIVLNMMIGLSTPPFGVLLFIVSGISDTPLKSVIREVLPMVLVMIAVLLLLTYVPEIVLFLPNLLRS